MQLKNIADNLSNRLNDLIYVGEIVRLRFLQALCPLLRLSGAPHLSQKNDTDFSKYFQALYPALIMTGPLDLHSLR